MSESKERSPSQHVLRWAGAILTVLACFGCGSRGGSSDLMESNTNWLSTCDISADCGDEFACECGVCTVRCEDVSCPNALECLAANECAGSASASCQAQCTADADCTTLDSGLECIAGVCAMTSGGLRTSDLSTATEPADPSDSDVTCRWAHGEYPAGAAVDRDGCASTDVCTCGDGGEWRDCQGTDALCNWSGPTRPCSDMFPGLEPGDALPGDAIDVSEFDIIGDELTLMVSHSGGCEDHDYALCFRAGGESYPVGVDLVLIHDAHDDGCEQGVRQELTFDLTPVATDYMEAYQSAGDVVRTRYGLYSFGELSCVAREIGSQIEFAAALSAASVACEVDADCVQVSNSTGCHPSCGVVLAAEGATQLQGAVNEIDATYCDAYEATGCGPALIPPCDAPGTPRCVERQCVEVYEAPADTCIQDNPSTAQTQAALDSLLQTNAEDCSAIGAGDVDSIMSAEAAACLARVHGLAEGLSDWSINLVCHAGHEVIVYNVTNLEQDEGPDGQSGSSITLDAQTGESLAALAWRAIP